MAMLSHRLRRVIIAVSSNLQRSFSTSRPCNFYLPSPRTTVTQPTGFTRFTAKLFSTTHQYQYDPCTGEDSFTPDNEGCDFNHWLITMDFSKENPPSREEMISVFEKSCAKGLDVSLEEAKKKIYAICTTSYQGFQATMSIGEVEKFRDLPRVQYIIPDSYADVENKVYGGDKYENGVITPGPVPVPSRDGFDSLEKESTVGQDQSQISQTTSHPTVTSGQAQDQGSRTRPDQRNFKEVQGALALRQGKDQGSQMLISGKGLDRGQGSQMTSIQGSFKEDRRTPFLGKKQGQGNQSSSFLGSFKRDQGTPCLGNGQAHGSQMLPFQKSYNEGQGTPISQQGKGQGSQIPSYQMSFSQGQGAQTHPCQGVPSNYSQGEKALNNQGAKALNNQGPSQGNFIQGTHKNHNQMGQGNYTPQSGGNYGPQKGAGSPEYGQGYSGQGEGRGGESLSPYNQFQGTPITEQGQIPSYQMGHNQGLRAPVPPYQGNNNQGPSSSYGQWVFVNYSQVPPQGNFLQGPPQGNFLQGPQQSYNQGGQRNFSPQNGGNYNPVQFGQVYTGHAQGQGNYTPQYQLSYNQGQGAPFVGQWHCQGCGMPLYPVSYNQILGTPNTGPWQDQRSVVPSYQASYSHIEGASMPPHQRNYNHGIQSSYDQGAYVNLIEEIPVNYNQTGQRNYNLQSGGNYGLAHGSTGFPRQGQSHTFQQEDQRNAAGEWSNNNNPTDQTEAGKVSLQT
ncbi:unnamed protein product [Cochlearia groenlandica]